MPEAPNAGGCGAVLVLQGLYLLACGCYGAASNDWAPRVMHSAYAGAGACAFLMVTAAMSVSGNYKLYMIGVHLALMGQAVFVLVFLVQSYKSYGNPEKFDRLPLFVAMLAGSLVGLGAMVGFKPKKKKDT